MVGMYRIIIKSSSKHSMWLERYLHYLLLLLWQEEHFSKYYIHIVKVILKISKSSFFLVLGFFI